MQKIQNLKQYTNSEIGIFRDAKSADDAYQEILTELKAISAAWKYSSEDAEGKEIKF